jgi:hypothetical protein
MKIKIINSTLVILMIIGSLFFNGNTSKGQAVQLRLQSSPWHFSDRSALSALSSQKTKANFTPPFDSSSFTIKMRVNLKAEKSTISLLNIPGVLSLTTFQHDPKDRKGQNYPAYPMPDGSVPVLEAALRLYPPLEPKGARDMPIGIPLAMLKKPGGKHEVVLHFSGVRWTLYVDNELLDNDFAIGYPKWGEQSTWEINPSLVSKAEIYFPGSNPQKVALKKPRISNEIQYWTPQGHNTWVGDVATFYHQGRYHIFYLFDRRGHGSKFGKGGHYFEHISTTDFKTWIEHDAATPIEAQWETIGTGTPFIFDNKLCLSYGLHTTRIYPKEQTLLPLQWDYYNTHGVTGSFRYDTIPGYPAGSTYSISEDGINFKKTKILFHPCENPSVYTDPEGRLRMLANYGAKGTWESKSINGGWRSINPNFPPGGDCTFFFRWGNYDYIIGGFTGFWTKPASAPEDKFIDGVKAGLDFYNGMNVPSVTQIKDGRFLLAGWIPMAGWGGSLTIHEMVQSPDGRIGTKWMKEIIPATQKERSLAKEIKETSTFTTESSSFLLTFDVEPGTDLTGKIGALLLGADGESHACEVQVSPKAKKAQYGKGQLQNFSGTEKSLLEGGSPSSARDYAIENLANTDKAFTVRIIVKYEDKFGGSQIDTEIAGQRTMIAFRPGLKVEKLLLRSEETGVKNVKIAALKN